MNAEYKAFLLRLRRSSEQQSWRISLENVHSKEQLYFANERDLLRYLLQVFSNQQSENPSTTGLANLQD